MVVTKNRKHKIPLLCKCIISRRFRCISFVCRRPYGERLYSSGPVYLPCILNCFAV